MRMLEAFRRAGGHRQERPIAGFYCNRRPARAVYKRMRAPRRSRRPTRPPAPAPPTVLASGSQPPPAVTWGPRPADRHLPSSGRAAWWSANVEQPVFLAVAVESRVLPTDTHGSRTRSAPAQGRLHETDDRLFSGVLRLFRPGLRRSPLSAWPRDGTGGGQLHSRGELADVGCGLGASTMSWRRPRASSLLRRTAPQPRSPPRARAAAEAGVAQRKVQTTTSAREFPAGSDLVCMFDCPARHGRTRSGPPGTPASPRRTARLFFCWGADAGDALE